MICKYKYGGKEFTETQLDDFLVEKGEYLDKLDLAFDTIADTPTYQLEAQSIIKSIEKDSKALRDLADLRRAQYTEEGETMVEYKPPYYGVNKYLATIIQETHDGLQLFPEFRSEDFWMRRKKLWLEGQFSDNEKEILFDNDEQKLQDWISKGWDNTSDLGKQELQRMQDEVVYKWKQQADMGTEIHKAYQLYFSNLGNKDIRKLLEDNLNKDLVPDAIIDQIIVQAETLHTKLKNKFGDNAQFYTELDVTQTLDEQYKGEEVRLLGIIDLLVIDRFGNVHVIDYKTSIKPYDQFDTSKKAAFTYQLATYQRMLQRYGLKTRCEESALIVPIEMTNFKKVGKWTDPDDGKEHDKWSYDGIKEFAGTWVDITDRVNKESVVDKLNEFIPTREWITLTTDKLQDSISQYMKLVFPHYGERAYSDEDIRDLIKEHKGFDVNDNGYMVFHMDKANFKDIVVKADNRVQAEQEMFNKVAKYIRSWPEKRANMFQDTISMLKRMMENPALEADFKHSYKLEDETGQMEWFKSIFEPYYGNNTTYELLNDTPQLSEMLNKNGIIAILNHNSRQIDFIKLSTQNLYGLYKFRDSKGNVIKDRNTLIGRDVTDLTEQQKTNSLITMSTYGNIELMEMMLVINNLAPNFQKNARDSIGRVLVANPITNRGITMSNEELLYNYSRLNDIQEIPNDNLLQKGTPIKFASRYMILSNQLADIYAPNGYMETNRKYKMIESCKNALEDTPESQAQDKIRALEKFIKAMQDNGFKMDTNPQTQNNMETRLYNNAVLALAELKGIKFRQQIEKYGNWFQSLKFWEKGLNSLQTDNPGHMNNETLNLMAKLVFEWNQGVRDDLQAMKPKLDLLVNKLKNDKGFNKVLEYTVGNQASLYSRMIYTDSQGDLLLVNPYEQTFNHPQLGTITLTEAERDFLKYFLHEINIDRQRNNEALFETQIQNNSKSYFMLPLVTGDTQSKLVANSKSTIENLQLNVLKYLQNLNPKTVARKVKQKLIDLNNLADKKEEEKLSDDQFFRMTTDFDRGYSDDRLNFIKNPQGGTNNFELNLETLLLKHKCAYATKQRVDEGVPMIKAALIHLTTMGNEQNRQFVNEIKYIRDFFKNKVKGETLVSDTFKPAEQVLSKLRSIASFMTLGFAPVQFFYQLLDGMWKDISLIIRKPDGERYMGTSAFTFEHMSAAAKDAFGDMFKGRNTKMSLLNQLYGLNDMDMNIYADRIKSDQWGIYNWRSLAFYSASRPDYYNRLTIFGAQMRADGTWDAHSLKDGKLVYDFSKDKRFSLLQDSSKRNTKEYQAQLGLYYAIANQFIKEGTKNADGTLFSISKDSNVINALPKAYTTKDAESMKSVCDNLYGFYSNERKSMIQATTIGALWMQYRTYWSGKKNQYLQSGGIKLQGKWVQAEDKNGEKMFDVYDEKTGLVVSMPESQVPEGVEKIPTFIWKGDWEEGIILTLTRLLQEAHNEGSLITAWSKMRQQDDNLSRVYKSNLQQLAYDLTMCAVVGSLVNLGTSTWLKELKKSRKEDTKFIDALEVAGANVLARSLSNSFLDFNFFESIGQPGVSWNPFAFTWAVNAVSNLYNLATGDATFMQTLVRSSGSMKQIKPVYDYIDLQIFHGGDKHKMPQYDRK